MFYKKIQTILIITLSILFTASPTFAATTSVILGTTGSNASGIAIDSVGNIYTANNGDNTVTKITPAGVSTVFGTTGAGQLDIAVDSVDNIYTSNFTDDTVTKITPAGVSTVFGTTGNEPVSITIDSSDNIYTANSDSTVTKITPAGVSTVFGTTGPFPADITVDTLGNIYTANNGDSTVTKITPAGVSSMLGITGDCSVAITVDFAGNVYVAGDDSDDVTKITPAGVVTLLAFGGSGLTGITIDPNGNVYTTDSGDNTVTKITPAGVSSVYGTTGATPVDIVLASNGDIYTVNLFSNNVTKISITPVDVEFVSDLSSPEATTLIPQLRVTGTVDNLGDSILGIQLALTDTDVADHTIPATFTIPVGVYANSILDITGLSILDDLDTEIDEDFVLSMDAGPSRAITFSDVDADTSTKNSLTYTIENDDIAVVVSSFKKSGSKRISKQRLAEIFGKETVVFETTKSTESDSKDILGKGNQCSSNTILTQNLKAPARNGSYHSYTKATVTEAKLLQSHMNRLGFKSGPEDGIIGPLTEGAIKRMQVFLGFTGNLVDGYVGPLTQGKINNSC